MDLNWEAIFGWPPPSCARVALDVWSTALAPWALALVVLEKYLDT